MLRSVYIENKGDPSPLVDPARYSDAEAIKAHLFNELIPALITKRRPVRDGSDPLRPRRGWEPSETRRWLAYLAVQLHGERDLRWWQLATTVPSGVITTLMGLVGGLTAWLIAGLIAGLLWGPLVGLAGVLSGALVVGPGFGLVVCPLQEPAWVGFVVTSRWLSLRGKLPWKVMGFLDDAHRLGLLRTAGSVYQFRHAELQDHLAKPGETAAPAPPMQQPFFNQPFFKHGLT